MPAANAPAVSTVVLFWRTAAQNCATSRAALHPPWRGWAAADDSRALAVPRKYSCTCRTDVDRDLACKSDVRTDLKVTWPG
jgi:hypothetical protein